MKGSPGPGRVRAESLLANGLTQMQEMFCQEYSECMDKKEAALKAGYSPKSAHSIANELYNQQRIRSRIREIIDARVAKYEVNAMKVQEELVRLAFYDPTQIIHKMEKPDKKGLNGWIQFKDLTEIPQNLRHAIQEFKVNKDGLQVKFVAKGPFIEMLAKHFGYFEKDNDQKRAQLGPGIYLPSNQREQVAIVPVQVPSTEQQAQN